MRSTYKKLGPYIQEVVEKNSDLLVELLLGVSISKEFIPSIANTIGTDMSRYKIVREKQFAYGPVTSRNSDKISIALLTEPECIISTSYTVFEIIDEDELLPEYLMMWFRRPEFDRYARFMSHGSVRELFGWDEMCDVELPIPSIEKQREIVKEYRTVVDRIRLNERLNEKLEEAAQAIFRQWFVEFEFPMTAEYANSIGKPELAGQPYKSNGGEMVYDEVLEQEIPKGWTAANLAALFDIQGGSQPPASEFRFEPQEGYVRFIQIRDYGSDDYITYIPESSRNKMCSEFDIMIARYGASLGRICFGIEGAYNVALTKVIPVKPYLREFLRTFLMTDAFYNGLQAIGDGKSAREGFSKDELGLLTVVFPGSDSTVLLDYSRIAEALVNYGFALKNERKVMQRLVQVVLSRLAVVA